MSVVRWEPFALQSLFDSVFETPSPSRGGALRRWMPAMDLVEDGTLTISGERRSDQELKKDGYVRVERAFGSFSRSLTLPKGIDAEGVTASFDRGVLEVSVPKPEERKPRRIEIAGATKTIEA